MHDRPHIARADRVCEAMQRVLVMQHERHHAGEHEGDGRSREHEEPADQIEQEDGDLGGHAGSIRPRRNFAWFAAITRPASASRPAPEDPSAKFFRDGGADVPKRQTRGSVRMPAMECSVRWRSSPSRNPSPKDTASCWRKSQSTARLTYTCRRRMGRRSFQKRRRPRQLCRSRLRGGEKPRLTGRSRTGP